MIMATIRRSPFDQSLVLSKTTTRKRLVSDWSPRKKVKSSVTEQYHCHVYLHLFPSTLKCSIDVLVQSQRDLSSSSSPSLAAVDQGILIGRTRLAKSIEANVVRVRLVSSLFAADLEVNEDPTLTKLETIRRHRHLQFDKQFALISKNSRLGPGAIGKVLIEALDPTTGSYTNYSPIFELNLHLSATHCLGFGEIDHRIDDVDEEQQIRSLPCGCRLSSDHTRLLITDRCNISLTESKVVHRLAEPLRCLWKSIGRDLSPCFTETDLLDIQQTYLHIDGNQECTYQLLREWAIREPRQANIRSLFTRLKLPVDLLYSLHNDVIQTFVV